MQRVNTMDGHFLQEADKVQDCCGDALFVLKQRTREGAKRRFCRLGDTVKNRLEYELEIIKATNTAKLFLCWSDVVSAIKQIVWPYIDSVQNCSLVSYCLGITEVNPLKTGSYFERLLNRQSAHVPVLFIEVPRGQREELRECLKEKAFIEIAENAARPDLPVKAAIAFFEGQTYEDKEILRRAAASLEFDGQRKPPETLGELTDLLVRKRYAEFTDEKASLLYQEDAVGLLVNAGLTCEEAECARRAFAKKNRREINFYRGVFGQTARKKGYSTDAANAIFSAVEKEINFTVCRASYVAMVQYLYMDMFFQKNIGTDRYVYKKIDG